MVLVIITDDLGGKISNMRFKVGRMISWAWIALPAQTNLTSDKSLTMKE